MPLGRHDFEIEIHKVLAMYHWKSSQCTLEVFCSNVGRVHPPAKTRGCYPGSDGNADEVDS
jgi:hypothetical protein